MSTTHILDPSERDWFAIGCRLAPGQEGMPEVYIQALGTVPSWVPGLATATHYHSYEEADDALRRYQVWRLAKPHGPGYLPPEVITFRKAISYTVVARA